MRSIPSNIAEGSGRNYDEFVQFLELQMGQLLN
jgi:four helix bundle protein